MCFFQTPEYSIDYDGRQFHPSLHVRAHGSRTDGDTVKTYLWPALREGKQGPCVHKAVVLT